MKKLLFSVLLSLLMAATYAQGVSVGVKGGLNLANQLYSGGGTIGSPEFLPGFHVGAYASLMPTKHLGLQPEILYSGQGSKSGGVSVNLNYVTVPVLLRYNVNRLLSFHAGPQAGFLVSAKRDAQDVKNQYKGNDVSLVAGGIIDLPMGLNFTLRYIAGLTDINDNAATTYKTKNYTVQVSVGYKLFGGK